MKLRIMPPRMGLTWIGHGLRACVRQPLGFVGLLGLVAMAALLLIGIPVIGPLAVVALMPIVWMGFMLASRRVLSEQRVTPGVLLEPLKDGPPMRATWAKLGGAYVLGTLLVMQLADAFGPGSEALATALESAKQASDVFDNPEVRADLLWRMGLTLPLSLVFWHTPALVYWGKLPVLKALFFSTVACWRNLGAFILFGLGWFGIALAVAVIDRALVAIVPEPMLVKALITMLAMWLASAFYASLYFTVVDCFEPYDIDPTKVKPAAE
ncbi:MAG: BPSS1780 family membrane protein [Pseudomonadota bacterium]